MKPPKDNRESKLTVGTGGDRLGAIEVKGIKR